MGVDIGDIEVESPNDIKDWVRNTILYHESEMHISYGWTMHVVVYEDTGGLFV